jgi:PAS domain S-box-containing protein
MDHLYRRLLAFTRDGVYRYRLDTGEILLANQGLADILGLACEPKELIGRRLRDVLVYTEREGTVRSQLEAAGEIHGYEYHFRTLAGEDRWVLHDSFIVKDPDTGERIVEAIVKDITERKLAEQALLAEKDRLAVTLQSIGDGVIATDAAGRVQLLNPVAETLTGWPAAEAAGRPLCEVFRIVNEHTRRPVENPLEKVLRTGWVVGLANHTALLARHGGERSIADSAAPIRNRQGAVIGAVLVFRDVTDARKLEASLTASESRYRLLFSRLSEGFALHEMIFDAENRPADYVFIEVNQAFEAATGLRARDVTGRRAREVLPALEPFWIETYGRVVQTGEPVTFDHWAEPLRRYYRVTAYRPQPGQFATVFLDLTEQRKAEEERRLLERQVQQAQKLDSLGMLAGGIAHDFNNLLVGVLGNAELALTDLPASAPVRPYLESIEGAARRAADLCRQMLAYAGRGTIEKRAVDLNRVVRETSHLLEVSISKKVVLKFKLAAALPPILADHSQIGQVLMNLVINASEAIGDKSGVVGIGTGAMECDADYLLHTFLDDRLPPGPYVYLEVADTGCGMDEATRQRIFDPFFSTKFAGRGLGLAAVLGIVRGCRGAIRVYSEPGRGTTFKLLFPASEALPAELADGEKADGAWRGEGLVLLVDDEDTVRTVGRNMLQHIGFRVVTAADGREAVEIFRQQPAQIACVVLDLTMPHMGGEETFRELRRIRPDTCVLLSSGYNEDEVADRFAGKGLAGYIQKPYRLAQLRSKLRALLQTGAAR